MKKVVILLLAVILAACSAPATPTQAPVAAVVEPSATPVVIVQTVVVEATQAPTEVPPTAVPHTAVPPTPVVVTVVVQPTQDTTVAQPAATQASGTAPIPLDDTLGKGVFTNMTMTSNTLTLRCSPRDITFNITTPNIDIKDVVFYYRTADVKRLYPKELKAFGKMVSNGNGNFTLTFSGEDIVPDYRLDGSLFDFQFVGLNKGGARVDSSQIIQDLVKFTLDCP
jgi:hypothetical protein